ncbi:MAG: DegT/DnrJ/EryC1/StrS family aminotransferase [Actinobacteria bacterium]|nr:DegT/DnrJ/EryC1/StrS family aminotransferase [Actinomycetota bacterium]
MLDPAAEYAEIGAAIESAIGQTVRSGRFIGGPEVEAFEEEFGASLGRPVAAVGSGTEALRMALIALGVEPGDEVVVPANTFTATAMAIEATGAVPVVCDVVEDYHVITAELASRVLSERTRVIVPVHLYGHPAPMAELIELARPRGIAILEDAAQAHGATVHGHPAGGLGDAAAFSFYPSKNLGAFGDAGAVAGSAEVIDRIRILRDLGRDADGRHVTVATNSRLDAIQAAVLRTKLPHLASWVERRRAAADRYRERLAELPLILPSEASWATHAYHLFVVRVRNRDRVRAALAERGIEAGIHYPTPIHLQAAHRDVVRTPEGAPVSERLAGEILSLPLYPQLTPAQQDAVTESLVAALNE